MTKNQAETKRVTKEEFEAIAKINPKIRVRSFQASGHEEYYWVHLCDGVVCDLEREFRASF